MIVLDCESYASTIKSISSIYDLKIEEIEMFFNHFDLDKHYEINKPFGLADDVIKDVFEASFNIEPFQLDKVCWFHLTRCLPEEDFHEGILPLTKSLDKVWRMFFSIFKETRHYSNLRIMYSTGIDDWQYNNKVGAAIHSGPYAMLVRDSAFNSHRTCSHDYLGMPEIIEDICNGYKKRFDISIISELERKLKPKIVKFISNKNIYQSYIGTALYYSYTIFHNRELSCCLNNCFDGRNSIVPCADILNVETIMD